ncbi:MAG: molybdenum cofactor guanylyltransferase [Phenylobacterium sp.]|uniref:molybdenum cofactor guanylyltransferase n=1 Tax=Phenylobacterium sp. TaxID=1871053 RepID=UPI0012050A28|nr:NTP transferase domain-containing protein [Phenylobacterium sp.]TAJ72472.1 MAG: molybdenum cofactor guanylyltransferase [Phenylobacterium sp.]
MRLAAIILTGGASSRMGADKAALAWNGRPAVDRLGDVARRAGAERILTAGGGDYGLARVDDRAPGGGPVAGIMAGVAALEAMGYARVLVLAVDAATVRPDDLAPLAAAASPGAAYEGLHLPLVMDIAAAPRDAGAGWAVGRLIERAGLARLPCAAGATERLRGANTPEERERLLVALIEAESAEEGGAA